MRQLSMLPPVFFVGGGTDVEVGPPPHYLRRHPMTAEVRADRKRTT